ncbi:MAG: formimidoylglutamate deiminase, partial [Pseudomonadota bacterium]
VETGQTPPADAKTLAGPCLPGMANIHSHAFQRAMAGHTEKPTGSHDSFWTWRDIMYRFAGMITPEDLNTIASQLYIEMLKSGYTAVGEFHYIHHQADGRPYDNPAALSEAVITASQMTGIGITHLPVLYQRSGFGSTTATDGQKRFTHTTTDFLDLLTSLTKGYQSDPKVNIGYAFHSLRAVAPEAMAEVLKSAPSGPVHIHIAEQMAEVEDCLDHHKQRPVAYLCDHFPVDQNWCLIHATHVNNAEIKAMTERKAIIGLCPTTEANLGDGLFPLKDFIDHKGRFAIGSDSHVSVNMIEEFRLLEYGQRLFSRSRSVALDQDHSTVGATLFTTAATNGAAALHRNSGKIETGALADLLVLDGDHPALLCQEKDGILDGLIFGANTSPIRDVMAGGKWVIENYRHAREEDIYRRFRQTLTRLYQA